MGEKCKIQLYFGLIILEDHYKNLVNDKCPIAMKKLNSLNHLSAKMKRTLTGKRKENFNLSINYIKHILIIRNRFFFVSK